MKRTAALVGAVALCAVVLGWHAGMPARASVGQPRVENSLVGVQKRTATLENFRLESGQILPEVTLAYETYGQLASDGRNAILIAHGYTSNHHAAGRYSVTDARPGWWDRLIGPGKAIDTTRFFVVSSNMLGSCYGSTGPASLNPATGKPYGPQFPDITMPDIVTAQRDLLTHLGVSHLVAVGGPSMGGRQAFQWAVTFPDFMDGIVAVASSPKGLGKDTAVADLLQRLAGDPNWYGGWYYD
ncbi:MAG: alpha/beta fold hydrolase, partial [Nitrospinae bacterium]|nr:alpha/beta fold hydrolase [Nitrospinota bacterium]